MYQLTDRCKTLRDEVMNKRSYRPGYCLYRAVYYPIGVAEARARGLSPAEGVAMGVARTAESFSPVIVPGELIVGHNFGDGDYFRYGGEAYAPEDTSQDREWMRLSGISEADIEAYYKAREIGDWPLPEVGLTAEAAAARQEYSALGNLVAANHSVIGYEKVLRLGFEGILDEVNRWAEKNGDSPEYRAMRILCEAGCQMGERYAEKARELLYNADPAYDAEDLKKIISACENVPRHPARSFREAVQALWFAHILNTWEDTINANSLGRLDQILYSFYRAGLEKGEIDRQGAFEIICLLWLKLYRDYDVQQSCVGGTNPDGSSAVNELSYMMLDATEQLGFIRCLSVRFSQRTEKEFLRRAMEVVGHVQKGVPFFFNDDVMIPALEYKGVSHEDACGYTEIGCVETVIPGKSNPHAVTGQCNLLKAIEFTLEDGRRMLFPEHRLGLSTGGLDSFGTYDQFYAAVKAQVAHMLEETCAQVRKHFDAWSAAIPRPYKSLLTEGCMESGKDFNSAGPLYDYYQIMLCGVPNLADSLAVIRKFVYDSGKYTLAQLREILENDYPDEAVRSEFIHKAPKYGNDLDEVDSIAADVIRFSCGVLDEMSEKYGLSFHAQPFTFLWMVDYGRVSAASPDGRHKGEILAYSLSPMQGRDYNGLTALFNTLAKLPTRLTPGTTSAIVEVDPKLFTDENIGQLTEVLRVSAAKGLSNVQFNTIDAETLMDAQKHPDKYNNLAVRVSGFSQKFNLLNEDLQNHIIGRTKHSCL